jgi:hypothetical protein
LRSLVRGGGESNEATWIGALVKKAVS